MTILLLMLLAFPWQPDRVVPATAGSPLADTQDQKDPQKAFEELRGRYQAALDAHSNAVRRLHRERVPEGEWPPHPAPEWLVQFSELAEDGAGRADLWILQNLSLLAADRPRQAQLAEISLRRLVEQHSDQAFMIEVFPYITRRRGLLGREANLELVTKLSDQSSNPEVAARAMYEQAILMSANFTSEDPDVVQRAMDLLRTAVDGFSGSEGAKFAANPLFDRARIRLWREVSDWAARVRLLVDQGVPSDQWPSLPLERTKQEMLGCARAGHPGSEVWIDVYFPAFEQAERRGLPESLFEFTRSFYLRSPSITGPSVDARFAVLQLLVEVWPDEPVMQDLTTMLLENAFRFPVERYRPLVEALTARTSKDEVRYPAWLALSHILMRSNREEEISEALELLSKVEEEAPATTSRETAGAARTALEILLPPSPAPAFAVADTEGFQLTSEIYGGRVMLVVFWSLMNSDCVEVLPEINGLHSHFEGRPFSVVGFNVDLLMPNEFRRQAREHGIVWRNALVGNRSELARTYGARSLPLIVLIDGEGIIQARGPALAGLRDRIEPLVCRAEEMAREQQGDR